MTMITFTAWARVKQPAGSRHTVDLEVLFARFATPTITDDKATLPGWAPTAFRDNYRELDRVEASFAIGLDLEKNDTNFEATCDAWANYRGLVHTTYRHRPDAHRLRVILPTTRPVTAKEYAIVWQWAAKLATAAGQTVDVQAKDPSRLWFVPGVAPGAEYLSRELHGALLDVDAVLRIAQRAAAAAKPQPRARTNHSRSPIASRIERARRYLDKIDPAVEGEGGSRATFVAAMKVVHGFDLPEDVAFDLMWNEYNPRCSPPWTEKDLLRKVAQAAARGRFEAGSIVGARRG